MASRGSTGGPDQTVSDHDRRYVGEAVQSAGAGKLHHPWRKTAWEIHPVIKLELAEGGAAEKTKPAAEATISPAPATSPSVTPTIAPTTTPEPVTKLPGFLVTVVQPIQLQLPTGNVLIPAGTRFRVRSNNAQYVNVEYLGAVYPVPIDYTDWK